jgi:sugar lactone lactonase YvrE
MESMRSWFTIWGLGGALLMFGACAGPGGDLPVTAEPPIAETDCEAVGDLEFICDFINPEDIIAVPDTDLVVVSGYAGGAIHFVSASSRTHRRVFPVADPIVQHDAATYPSCPGPIDPAEGEAFSAHGLNLRLIEDGRYLLYVVHHGFRESIEFFEIETRDSDTAERPSMMWVGCVVAPESVLLNSVSPLPSGGFVTTGLSLQRDADGGTRVGTGVVWEWHPVDGWTIVPGSESPGGPNGIEASADGNWLYVNLHSGAQLMRLSRSRTPFEREVVDLTFYPDNIRWQTDGSLLIAGQGAVSMERIIECLRTFCSDMTSHVAVVNPDTLAIEGIVNFPANEVFFTATSALQVGDEIWVGSMRGDRIARFSASSLGGSQSLNSNLDNVLARP